MNLSGRACLWIVAGAALASAGCGPAGEPPQGAYIYGCYNGPLANTDVVVTWSENGTRGDTTIAGRSYIFRQTERDLLGPIYKDGEAKLSIDPELVFNPGGQGANSMCNPGQPVEQGPG